MGDTGPAISFGIGGAVVRLQCESSESTERIAELLTELFDLSPSEPKAEGRELWFRLAAGARAPELGGRVIYRSGLQAGEGFAPPLLSVLETAAGFGVRSGSSWVEVDLRACASNGSLGDDFWRLPVQVQRAFFSLPFFFLLPQFGLFALHANGVVDADGSAFLIAGGSGRGKTTLTLALLRAGWRYLSDDTVLLREQQGRVEALNFRKGFACTARTLRHFAELTPDVTGPASRPWKPGKVWIDVDEIYPQRRLATAEPRVILLPEIADREHSALEPLEAKDASQALASLIQQSPGVMVGRTGVEGQMAVLRRLVATTRQWRLRLGRDVFQDPEAVSHLLTETKEAAVAQGCR